MAVPAALLDAVRYEKSIADQTTARIEQHAMASFIGRGELDRHLRRMRLSYRARRDATIAAVGRELPDASDPRHRRGPARDGHAGRPVEEAALLEACARRRVAISTISDYVEGAFAADPTLLLGYAQLHEAAIPAAVAELAAAVREAGWPRSRACGSGARARRRARGRRGGWCRSRSGARRPGRRPAARRGRAASSRTCGAACAG